MNQSVTLTRIFVLILLCLMGIPEWSDGRGGRGGGGRGGRGGGGGGRARVSHSAPRRSVSRPVSRPSTLPVSRPNLSRQPVNRTPALTNRPSGAVRPASLPARPKNPKLQPLFNGTPTARAAAGRKRMDTAIRRDPSTVGRFKNPQVQAARVNKRNNWGSYVRAQSAPIRRNTYNAAWMSQRINRFPQRWFYWHRPHPSSWWWRRFAWAGLGAWIVYDWDDPFYYDYGYNVYNEDETVFINEEPVASYDDYVTSAEALVENFKDPPEDEETEWESLGTWMLSTDPNAQDAGMMLQLVLSKEGLVSGTYHHIATDATQPVQGTLDKENQRIAFTIGGKETTILETGIANLTKENAPVWVHFTDQRKTQTWLMVRLEAPEGETE